RRRRAFRRRNARRLRGEWRSGALALAHLGGVVALAAALADVLESVGEELLELLDRAALEKHVPVGAGGLLTRVVDLGRTLRGLQDRLVAARAALPCGGRLGVCREHQLGLTPTDGADVRVLLAFHEHDALFALKALGAESDTAKAAICHVRVLSSDVRSNELRWADHPKRRGKPGFP